MAGPTPAVDPAGGSKPAEAKREASRQQQRWLFLGQAIQDLCALAYLPVAGPCDRRDVAGLRLALSRFMGVGVADGRPPTASATDSHQGPRQGRRALAAVAGGGEARTSEEELRVHGIATG